MPGGENWFAKFAGYVFAGCVLLIGSTAPAHAYKALVFSVHDGDSIRIQHNGSKRIRLAGVDAPGGGWGEPRQRRSLEVQAQGSASSCTDQSLILC